MTDREKIKEALENIVPDAELNAAWGNANFGHDDKRSVVMDTLWKVVCGYGTGSTALRICTDLKLIKGYRTRRGEVTLTKRGQDYFREAAYHRASQAATKPAGGVMVGDIILFNAVSGHPVYGEEQEFIGRVQKDAKGLYAANYYQHAWKNMRIIEPLTRKENGE